MGKENLLNEQDNFDIAVIGKSGRFPGAKTTEEFWQNLRSGSELVKFFTDEELLKTGIDPALLQETNYVKAASMLDGPELFDASFFGYSPREAAMMDPQHRIFLECAWEALEQAGYDADRYDGSIAVYAGASMSTYFLFSGLISSYITDGLATLIGTDKDFLTTRVSYKLNLKGPSIAIGTGCSTSLVAIHLACQSLLNQECDMAMAGGATVRVPHKAGYLYQQGGIASPDGHCRAFDAEAQGTIFGSGVGVVLLKRLSDAVADGDYIHAVIKGSAINNDGNAKVGYTAPSVDGQSQVILEALANSGVEADTISYIETHGTGTALGDPVEMTALTRSFRHYTENNGFCAIGSVKTNIGHLDVAAGVAGFIKTVLALENKMIPATLHYKKPNPEIDFQNSPFYVNSQLAEWQPQHHPRRAGVSSFGVGGTNAHVILEEAPEVEKSGTSRSCQLLLLSAKTDTALETATKNLAGYIKQHPDLDFADIAYTLKVGRKSFDYRRMLVCKDRDDAVTSLELLEPKRVITSDQEPVKRNVVFIFSGQGSQYVNMGLELYETEPFFREQIDHCAEILRPLLDFDLREVIYPAEKDIEKATQTLLQTSVTQPALFTIEYALARLWMKWGVNPEAMVGHSIGEYVAACLAGVFSLEDALALVAARGRLMQEQPSGSMLAVFLSEEEIQPLLNNNLSLAVINGPSLCVVSGEKEVVEEFKEQLAEKNVTCRHVHTSHAFHSAMMDPVIDAFTERVKQVTLNTPQIPFVSNVTGTWITPDEAVDPTYWARHLRQTVRFSDCLEELLIEPNRVFLEVGPGKTFSTLTQQHPARQKEHIVLSSTRHPKEEKSDAAFILGSLGELWLSGVPIDWGGFYAEESRHRLPLPTYPFERQRYWYEEGEQKPAASMVFRLSGESDKPEISGRKAAVKKDEKDVDEPVGDVEQELAKIWRDTLGVKHVNNDDNFFDLGGSSLMAVRLFTNIEKIFGKKLPLATLIEAPTIAQLADIIRDENAVPFGDSLVRMQSGNTQSPLYLVHAAGGNLLIYRDLIKHLGADLPVYGLQAKGLDGIQPFHTRIEDMAAQYVQEIQTIQPQGPYLLGGYCMGGSIALEMAQQFYAQGQEVVFLALMETYDFSGVPSSIFDKVHYRMQQIEFHIRNLLISDRKKIFLHEKAKVAWSRKDIVLGTLSSKLGLKSRLGNNRNSVLSSIWEACDKAAVYYVPKVYPGKITQFRPFKEYACFSSPEVGWDALAGGGLETYDLHVYPRGMLVEPFVKLLAEKMKICIQKALEKYQAEAKI